MGSRTHEHHGQLLKELNEERLAALTRISRTLEQLIAQARELHDRILATPPTARERDLAAYHDIRTRARRYRWYLEVQREALGLRDHRLLDEWYRVPDAIIEPSRGGSA